MLKFPRKYADKNSYRRLIMKNEKLHISFNNYRKMLFKLIHTWNFCFYLFRGEYIHL